MLAEAEPNDSETWIALGDAYRDLRPKFAEAVDAYDHAEKLLQDAGQARLAAFLRPRAMAGRSKPITGMNPEADIQIWR